MQEGFEGAAGAGGTVMGSDGPPETPSSTYWGRRSHGQSGSEKENSGHLSKRRDGRRKALERGPEVFCARAGWAG